MNLNLSHNLLLQNIRGSISKYKISSQVVVVHAVNPSLWKAEADEFL